MSQEKETPATIKGRLDVLRKGLISEENSVQYYQTLIEKSPADNEEQIGARRMYEDLKNEELKHVERFRTLVDHWEKQLRSLASES